MADEDGEADLLQRSGELLGEARLVPRIAVEKRPDIERRDLIILVERVAFMLGKAVGVRLAHLVEAVEILVERGLRGGRHHQASASPSSTSGASAAWTVPSRRPLSDALAITAAA